MPVDNNKNTSPYSYIIFFDGICNLCNRSIDWIIKRDKKEQLKYSSLQSEFAEEFLKIKGEPTDIPDSIYFFHEGTIYQRSAAIVKILEVLSFPWPLVSRLMKLVPSSIADKCYDYIATRRYKWMGKRKECRMPSDEESSLFLL